MDGSVVVDGSVWVSWLITQDANHVASRLWMERYITIGGLLIAPALVLIEDAAAISRQTGQIGRAKEEAKNLSSVRAMRLVPLDSMLVWAAIDVDADLKLGSGETTYVSGARNFDIRLA